MPYKFPAYPTDSFKLPDYIKRFAVYEDGVVKMNTDHLNEAMSYVQDRFCGTYRITVIDRELQKNIFDILPSGQYVDYRFLCQAS